MTTLAELRKKMLANPETKRIYDKLGLPYEIISQRIKKKMTQAQLARRVGTKQSAIARLESGGYNPSLEMLQKVAKALDAKLKISIN